MFQVGRGPEPAEGGSVVPSCVSHTRLQLGRGPEPAEGECAASCMDFTAGYKLAAAFGRGRPAHYSVVCAVRVLAMVRGLSAAEGVRVVLVALSKRVLAMVRGLSAAKGSESALPERAGPLAYNGPRPFGRGRGDAPMQCFHWSVACLWRGASRPGNTLEPEYFCLWWPGNCNVIGG